MTTRRDFALLATFAAFAASGAARAEGGATAPQPDPAAIDATIRELYLGFAAAQNDRDLARVRASLWEDPAFLWVSDGRPYWGRETMLERMARFQKAEVWRVEPDLERGRVVSVAPGAAYLSLPLTLAIGPAANPSRLRFLVGVLCRCVGAGDDWRIAALFTTEDKSS